MDDKNDNNIISVISDIILTYMQRISDLLHLAALEAQLALKTLVFLAILIFLLGSVITVFWLSILAFLFIYLLTIHYSMLSACAIVVSVNVGLLVFILFIMYRIKDNLFFNATVHQLNYNPQTETKHG